MFFWLYTVEVHFSKTEPNCFEKSILDISTNKWSFKVTVIKGYKMAYCAIFIDLTSQLFIKFATSLNVIRVNVIIS